MRRASLERHLEFRPFSYAFLHSLGFSQQVTCAHRVMRSMCLGLSTFGLDGQLDVVKSFVAPRPVCEWITWLRTEENYSKQLSTTVHKSHKLKACSPHRCIRCSFPSHLFAARGNCNRVSKLQRTPPEVCNTFCKLSRTLRFGARLRRVA